MLKAPSSIPRYLFHFLGSLLQRGKTMLIDFFSFFNELSIEKRSYACNLCFIF
jgi:hypothetical protein